MRKFSFWFQAPCCVINLFFRCSFRLARKSNQFGLSKSKKRLAERNATKMLLDVKALWQWNRYLKCFLRQMNTFRNINCGWSANCAVWQFFRHIGASKSKNKIKRRQKPTRPISQKVTHSSWTLSQPGLTSVTSKITWLTAIWDDDDETDPKCLRGLPTHPTKLH